MQWEAAGERGVRGRALTRLSLWNETWPTAMSPVFYAGPASGPLVSQLCRVRARSGAHLEVVGGCIDYCEVVLLVA